MLVLRKHDLDQCNGRDGQQGRLDRPDDTRDRLALAKCRDLALGAVECQLDDRAVWLHEWDDVRGDVAHALRRAVRLGRDDILDVDRRECERTGRLRWRNVQVWRPGRSFPFPRRVLIAVSESGYEDT